MAYEVSIQIPVVVVSYRVGFVHEKVKAQVEPYHVKERLRMSEMAWTHLVHG